MRRSLVALAITVVALGGSQFSGAAVEAQIGIVASVSDGDTLTLTNGQRVRLVQIDTPELGSGECYSRAARTALVNLVALGTSVALETDARLDKVDRYGRLLRYVHHGSINVNLQLVKRGAAAPYFYRGDQGRYASQLMAAARSAKAAGRGLWRACSGTRLDPYRALDTGTSGPPTTTPPPTGKCDPSYAGGCVPPAPPDLDCADIESLGITTPVRVVGIDSHRLDGDGDGLGCETAPGGGPPPPGDTPTPRQCDPNYFGGCVPPYPPDVDCADIRALGIAPVRVIGSDPHGLDGDNDGYGCE